jgi:Aldehyde dehydrogenase family
MLHDAFNSHPDPDPTKQSEFDRIRTWHMMHLTDMSRDQVELAVSAAEGAFISWSELDPSCRAVYLNKMADLIDARYFGIPLLGIFPTKLTRSSHKIYYNSYCQNTLNTNYFWQLSF